jgi:hypothetical protein
MSFMLARTLSKAKRNLYSGVLISPPEDPRRHEPGIATKKTYARARCVATIGRMAGRKAIKGKIKLILPRDELLDLVIFHIAPAHIGRRFRRETE